MGEHAGRPDHQNGVPERSIFILTRDQAVARRERQLHGIREADHHDQWRHHVQEHVEVEIGPPKAAEREQNRDHRREGSDNHEGYLAEEDDGDDAAGQNSQDVVSQSIALDGVANFQLHYRNAREFGIEAASRKIVSHQLANFADRRAKFVACDNFGFERQNDQRQRAVFGQQLAADDLVGFDGLDEFLVLRAGRQVRREQRRWQLAGRRRLTGREQRNQAAGALHQLQVRDEFTHSFEIFARKQRLAFDHDQHVEFSRGEALGFGFVLTVFLGIGPEQLAKRIVDFYSFA